MEKITREGYEKLEDKLGDLEQRLARALKQAGEAAGQESDWHDNPAYEHAQEDARRLQKQINELQARMRRLEVVEQFEKRDPDKVEIGDTVTILVAGQTEVYEILGVGEGSPAEGRISSNSALGRSLLGARRGQEVSVQAPGGRYKAKVVSIQK